ncbi:MAG: hypothetical protein RL358_1285 [Pseudomonadota bacterium]|jgi:predicted nucleotidyltransferase
MRVSSSTISTLTRLSRQYFGEDAELRLFGSRVNDQARGGDIDIQVIAPNASFRDEVFFLAAVDQQLDERVDLRVQRSDILLIDKIAAKNGVLLNAR